MFPYIMEGPVTYVPMNTARACRQLLWLLSAGDAENTISPFSQASKLGSIVNVNPFKIRTCL